MNKLGWTQLITRLSLLREVILLLVRLLVGLRHFGVDRREYKHEAQASVSDRQLLTRLRFVIVADRKVALSNYGWFKTRIAALTGVAGMNPASILKEQAS